MSTCCIQIVLVRVFLCVSQFGDIYDVDHFISYFKNDVQIIRQLPEEYAWSTADLYAEHCLERPNCLTFVAKHTTTSWYLEKLPPLLERQKFCSLNPKP